MSDFQIFSFIIAIMGVVIALLSFNYTRSKDSEDKRNSWEQRIQNIELKYTELNSKFDNLKENFCEFKNNFWRDLEATLAKRVHQDTTPDTDVYLEKLIAGDITREERGVLFCMLGDNLNQNKYKPELVPSVELLKSLLISV